MKIIQVISLVISFFLLSCSSGKNGKINYYTKDNIIYQAGSDKPFTGKINIMTEGKHFEYYVKNGLKEGEFKITFEKGNLIMKGNIVEGNNQGKWIYYYSTGQLESEGYFNNNMADSIWTWYFPDGKIKEKGLFVKGTRMGEWKMYDESGVVTMDNIYVLADDSLVKGKKGLKTR